MYACPTPDLLLNVPTRGTYFVQEPAGYSHPIYEALHAATARAADRHAGAETLRAGCADIFDEGVHTLCAALWSEYAAAATAETAYLHACLNTQRAGLAQLSRPV